MRFGITKLLLKLQITLNVNEFDFRKKLFGFDNANAFLRRLDKNSMIPILKRNRATIGSDCDIEAPLIFHNCSNFSNLIIGNNCHIGKNCFFDLRSKVEIDDNVVISMQSTFITHQDMNKSGLKAIYPATTKAIFIKENCYIGARVTILQGVKLGKSSVVAAGSLVTKNVEPFSLVGGVPAKFIKTIEMD